MISILNVQIIVDIKKLWCLLEKWEFNYETNFLSSVKCCVLTNGTKCHSIVVGHYMFVMDVEIDEQLFVLHVTVTKHN